MKGWSPKETPQEQARRIIWLHDLCRLHVGPDCSLRIERGDDEGHIPEQVTVTRPLGPGGAAQVIAKGRYEEVVYQITGGEKSHG